MTAEMPTMPGTETVGESATAGERVGCLVLAIGPRADMAWIAEAVEHAEVAVDADPVIDGTAEVATVTGADLDGDLDAVADVVGRQLREWALAPGRNPATRVACCLLVVHPDPDDADTLVRGLAATSTLARLPLVVLAGVRGLDPTSQDPHTEVVRMVLDAADSTVQEIGRTPGLAVDLVSLPVSQEPRPAPPDGRPPSAGRTPWWRSWPRPVRHRRPATGYDVIDGLSEIADRVTVLYLVLVAEPSRSDRSSRRRRLDVAVALGRAVLARSAATPADQWFVRAFVADQRLRPGRPLPASAPLSLLDLPQRRREPFDLAACVDDLHHAARLDRSAFVRRGVRRPSTVIVFVSAGPPTASDRWPTLSRLRAEARVLWVDLRPAATRDHEPGPDPDDGAGSGVVFLHDHDDVVAELVTAVTRPALAPRPRKTDGGRA